ncbi:interleukin-15 receptor subunit alpha isoform X4 [Corvus hawaiiensis]|uniref:interleukin-15 receptor subunit alpha isoform X4 n=1 Tax=Corvus hawaiiensis TaxID=134902 RepID=UPI002019EB65|nr:interleukin-15 receptor subunit alpha isoform X4 [Corvus hawaiiensis]XP_048156150.1 interleukin-15 receptor subunit alpha isoform X4 [Corvus hawaiiensis]
MESPQIHGQILPGIGGRNSIPPGHHDSLGYHIPLGRESCLISCQDCISSQVRCSRPKAVANAHIDAGNRTELNSLLRYSCNPGYKRKAGTSSLIQCILWNGSEPRWTDPTLQCIRDPALSQETPSPELPPAPHMESTTQRAGTTCASPNSSPSPASSQSPVPPASDGMSPDRSRPPETLPTLDTSTLGEGTTPLLVLPTDYAAVAIQSVASSVGKLGKKTYLGKEGLIFFIFFKLKSPFGGCRSFIPWPMGMPPRGGRIQHPNFFTERRIPNSIPPGVGMASWDGARSGL